MNYFLPTISDFPASDDVACPKLVEHLDKHVDFRQLTLHRQQAAQRRFSSHVHLVSFHPGDLVYVFDKELAKHSTVSLTASG